MEWKKLHICLQHKKKEKRKEKLIIFEPTLEMSVYNEAKALFSSSIVCSVLIIKRTFFTWINFPGNSIFKLIFWNQQCSIVKYSRRKHNFKRKSCWNSRKKLIIFKSNPSVKNMVQAQLTKCCRSGTKFVAKRNIQFALSLSKLYTSTFTQHELYFCFFLYIRVS